MMKIKKVRTNYNDLSKKLDDMVEIITLYHDQPLNFQRTSEYLGLAKGTIYKLTHQHKIPHYKPTGSDSLLRLRRGTICERVQKDKLIKYHRGIAQLSLKFIAKEYQTLKLRINNRSLFN